MNSVEIFKTNVSGRRNAEYLLAEIEGSFPAYKATIDMDDRDKVLRVEAAKGEVKAEEVIKLLERRNFNCEILNY